jgi:hypothetical protein
MVGIEGYGRGRAAWIALGLAALVAVLLSIPAIIPTFEAWQSPSAREAVSHNEMEEGQTDLLAYVLPPRYHPVLGDWVHSEYNRLGGTKNFYWMPYLGIVPLALAVFAAVKHWRTSRFWAVTGLLWIVLALGAILRVRGQTYPSIKLPYALFGQYFPFDTLRTPDRFNILVPLSLAALVGIALSHSKRRWVIGLTAGLVLFEYLFVPIPMQTPPLSPFVQQMAEDTEQYAILDLPMGRSWSKLWMYMQTIHGKPLVEGMAARTPPQAYAFVNSIPLLQAFRSGVDLPPDIVSADLNRLSETGVRYILIHQDAASPEDVLRWTSLLQHPPVFLDETLIVYSTDTGDSFPVTEFDDTYFCLDPASPAGSGGIPTVFQLGEEVRLVAWAPEWNGPVRPGDPLRLTLCWVCEAPLDQSFHVFVHLVTEGSPPVAQGDGPPAGGIYPTNEWIAGNLIPDSRILTLPDDLPPGRYSLLVGLYSYEDGERLPAIDGQGLRLPLDAIPLGEVDVHQRE